MSRTALAAFALLAVTSCKPTDAPTAALSATPPPTTAPPATTPPPTTQPPVPTHTATPAAARTTTPPPPPPKPAPKPTPKPTPKPKPTLSTCGAPANPWGYNLCGRGGVIYDPPGSFCDVFDCIPSFWDSTNGYVMRCADLTYSHSGGRSGSCSHHGGNDEPLYG